jgi:Pyruvate/2-oxoacid:ferredoxin oxidoreductase delta subunit
MLDPFRQINALDWVQKKAKFANHTKNLNCETLVQHRKRACKCALCNMYSGEPAWKAVDDRLQRPYYLRRVDHDWKIRNRRQRMGIGKYSILNRTIQLWSKLPMNALGTFPSKPSTLRKRVRKVISEFKVRRK